MSDGGPPGQGLRLPQRHGTGGYDGHVGERLGGKGKTAEKRTRRERRVAGGGQSSPIGG